MAITQVTTPLSVPATNADWTNMTYHLKANRLGLNNPPFILTNDDNTSIPAIAIGSYIQFGDSLYIVDTSDYTIQGTPVDGNNYIRIEPSGTTLIATWIQDKSSYSWNPVNNYYEISASDYALLPYLVLKDGTEYEKYTMPFNITYKTDQNTRTTDDVVFNTVSVKGLQLVAISLTTANTEAEAYTAITNIIGTSLTYKSCFGMIGVESAYIVTAGAGLVRIYSLNTGGSESQTTFASSSSDTISANVDIIINKGLL